MSTLTVVSPKPVATPRAAVWAAEAAYQFLSALDGLMHWHRAASKARSLASEARRGREIARQMAAFDPRVAREIEIAADRHEQGL
jgi:hypothetical protein